MQYKVTLKAESPLAVLASRVSAQFAPTLDYIPGSAIRGAFAEVFINKLGIDDDFKRIFPNGAIRFSDFWPTFSGNAPTLIPATAAACKRFGLKHSESLHDRLLDDLLKKHHQIKLPQAAKKCPDKSCTESRDRVKATYLVSMNAPQKLGLKRQLRMHVGISRRTATAAQGQLFSYDMLTPESDIGKDTQLFFTGFLTSDSNEAEALFNVLQRVAPPEREHLSVGKARTRGMGELAIDEFAPDNKPGPVAGEDFDARWNAFNELAQNRSGKKDFCCFSLTLTSHLALTDNFGMPMLNRLDRKDLGLEDALSEDDWKNRISYTSRALVSGWNAAQGLPKPDVLALRRGSVIGVAAHISSKNEEDELKTALKKLEIKGVGERRAEGFGQIVVCHPFHQKFGKEPA